MPPACQSNFACAETRSQIHSQVGTISAGLINPLGQSDAPTAKVLRKASPNPVEQHIIESPQKGAAAVAQLFADASLPSVQMQTLQ